MDDLRRGNNYYCLRPTFSDWCVAGISRGRPFYDWRRDIGRRTGAVLRKLLVGTKPRVRKRFLVQGICGKGGRISAIVVFTATSAGFFSGYVIRALLIGIFAILANLRDGIRSFSDNVHDTYLEDNVTTPPRLVSGLPQDHFINAVNLIRAFPLATLWGVGGAIGVCVLYLPWYIFRFVVKSAAWIYLPLLCAISILQATLSASGR